MGVDSAGEPARILFGGAGPDNIMPTPGGFRDVDAMREAGIQIPPTLRGRVINRGQIEYLHDGNRERILGMSPAGKPPAPTDDQALNQAFEASQASNRKAMQQGRGEAATAEWELKDKYIKEFNASAPEQSMNRKADGSSGTQKVETEAFRLGRR